MNASRKLGWNPRGTTVGIDLAKNILSVHGIDEHGKAVMKRTVSRGKVMEVMAGIGPCLVGVEACSGAHHWARELGRLGHAVKIMAPRFVAPYRKSGKNDGNDAEAIRDLDGRILAYAPKEVPRWDDRRA